MTGVIVITLGLPTGTDLVLEVLNGNGIGALENGCVRP